MDIWQKSISSVRSPRIYRNLNNRFPKLKALKMIIINDTFNVGFCNKFMKVWGDFFPTFLHTDGFNHLFLFYIYIYIYIYEWNARGTTILVWLRNIKKQLLWHQRPKVNAFLNHKLHYNEDERTSNVISAFSWSDVYIYIYIYIKYPVRWKMLLSSARSGNSTLNYPNCVISLVGGWWGQGIARAFTRFMMNIYIYIYIFLFGPVKPELGGIPSGQKTFNCEPLNFSGKELNVTDITEQ